jgi:hypothetical protein
MSTFKTAAQRLHRICIKAQTGKPHGLSLHKFGLICAMRGYRLVDGGGFIAIEPAAGLE